MSKKNRLYDYDEIEEMTGLSRPTIRKHAKLQGLQMINGSYVCYGSFVDFLLKNVKPRKRGKNE